MKPTGPRGSKGKDEQKQDQQQHDTDVRWGFKTPEEADLNGRKPYYVNIIGRPSSVDGGFDAWKQHGKNDGDDSDDDGDDDDDGWQRPQRHRQPSRDQDDDDEDSNFGHFKKPFLVAMRPGGKRRQDNDHVNDDDDENDEGEEEDHDWADGSDDDDDDEGSRETGWNGRKPSRGQNAGKGRGDVNRRPVRGGRNDDNKDNGWGSKPKIQFGPRGPQRDDYNDDQAGNGWSKQRPQFHGSKPGRKDNEDEGISWGQPRQERPQHPHGLEDEQDSNQHHWRFNDDGIEPSRWSHPSLGTRPRWQDSDDDDHHHYQGCQHDRFEPRQSGRKFGQGPWKPTTYGRNSRGHWDGDEGFKGHRLPAFDATKATWNPWQGRNFGITWPWKQEQGQKDEDQYGSHRQGFGPDLGRLLGFFQPPHQGL